MIPKTDPFEIPPRTQGSLGNNDAADPNKKHPVKGPTPSSLGVNDHADPDNRRTGSAGALNVNSVLTGDSVASRIQKACEDAYDPMLPCNFYVRNVVAKLPPPLAKIELPEGMADDMVKTFDEKWKTLKGAIEAMQYAASGAFVIVGLKSSNAAADSKGHKPQHGHVAVIVQGMIEGGPKCYSTNVAPKKDYDGKSRGDKKLFGWVFKKDDSKNVRYYVLPEQYSSP